MTAGLQIFKSDGSISLNIDSLVFKELGTFHVYSLQNGSYQDISIGSKDIFLVVKDVKMTSNGVCHGYVYPTHLKYENNTFTWDYADTHFNQRTAPTIAKYDITYSYGWLS